MVSSEKKLILLFSDTNEARLSVPELRATLREQGFAVN